MMCPNQYKSINILSIINPIYNNSNVCITRQLNCQLCLIKIEQLNSCDSNIQTIHITYFHEHEVCLIYQQKYDDDDDGDDLITVSSSTKKWQSITHQLLL